MDYYGSTYGATQGGSMVGVIIALVILLITVIAWWRLFTKAGEAGWKAIIPVYNVYTMFKVFWKRKFFFILLVLSIIGVVFYAIAMTMLAVALTYGTDTSAVTMFPVFVGIYIICIIAAYVFYIMMYHRVSKAFGHGGGFTVGLVLLNPIFIMILAFGSSQYIGDRENGADMQIQ